MGRYTLSVLQMVSFEGGNSLPGPSPTGDVSSNGRHCNI